MSDGCCSSNVKFDGASTGFKRALWYVIAINATMFAVELFGGALVGSQALKADALDFLADAATYGLSLWAIGRSVKTRANAAILKGISLLLMGAWVFSSSIYQVFILQVPAAPLMGLIGLMAFAANIGSVLILVRYKDGDANVRSVWLCSRNDAISNLAVIAAAAVVWFTQSAWPDLLVAIFMAGLFTRSAIQILKQAWAERTASAEHPNSASVGKTACSPNND
ncbi:MAG: cation diffusion facilitator family transporter [Motiliproteus sp.]|jgi:cation diffusion facilitator family transporter